LGVDAAQRVLIAAQHKSEPQSSKIAKRTKAMKLTTATLFVLLTSVGLGTTSFA
jgi:hypothetical protein